MYPQFRDRPGLYEKAAGAWDKGATHVLHVKYTDPPADFYTADLFAGTVTERTRCTCVAGLGDRKLAGWQCV